MLPRLMPILGLVAGFVMVFAVIAVRAFGSDYTGENYDEHSKVFNSSHSAVSSRAISVRLTAHILWLVFVSQITTSLLPNAVPLIMHHALGLGCLY